MLPWTRCCSSCSSGLAEKTRKSSALWEISVTVKHLIKKASPLLPHFITMEAEQKMYASFRRVRVLPVFTATPPSKPFNKQRIKEEEGDEYSNSVAKIQVCAMFRVGDIQRNVLLKFIRLRMETPCMCPSEGHKCGGRKLTKRYVIKFSIKSPKSSSEDS